jgi:urease accessory protein UreF
VGSFAYSFGLESLAKHSCLRQVEDMEFHLDCSLEQWLHFDLQLLASMRRSDEWVDAIQSFWLQTRVPGLRRAATTQGRAWLRFMEASHPEINTQNIRDRFKLAEQPEIYLAIYAMGTQAMGISFEQCAQLYIYGCMRDQVSSAIRLGLLGPTLGHTLLSRQWSKSFELPDEAQCHHRKAVKTYPLLDTAQLGHEALYSKQFQN